MNKTYNHHHDLVSFTDQVDILMEDDNALLDQFDKIILWEKKENSEALGGFSKEERKLM